MTCWDRGDQPRRSADSSNVKVMREAIERANHQQRRKAHILDPREHGWVQHWDMLMMACLIFVAIMTPYEVSFLQDTGEVDALFVVNLVLDGAFLCDLILQFNMAYQDATGVWIVSPHDIRMRYLKGWFPIDFVSICPFWVIGRYIISEDETARRLAEAELTESATDSDSGSATDVLRMVRVVRLLRLLKLFRVLKASRIFKRFETQMEITYAQLALCRHILFILGWSHLQACLWGLLPYFEVGHTWTAELEISRGVGPGELPPFEVFLAAWYWSVMTITSIGYGEMLPVNAVEHAVCTLCMLFSCTLWAYVMGSACAMAATMDPEGVAFRTNLDSLNYFMKERHLPREERVRLREYFHNSRKLQRHQQEAELLRLMSPKQQGQVALHSTKAWLERVWYLRAQPGDLSQEHESFVAAIAMKLVTRAFVTQERIGAGNLYILARGLAVRRWRFLNAGKVWGEDMILDNRSLMDHQPAVCLTYCEVNVLSRADLEGALFHHPHAAQRISKATRRICLQRALIKRLRAIGGLEVKSFDPDAIIANPRFLNTEQKLDILLECNTQAADRYDALIGRSGQGSSVWERRSFVTGRRPEEDKAMKRRISAAVLDPASVTAATAKAASAASADSARLERVEEMVAQLAQSSRLQRLEEAVTMLAAGQEGMAATQAQLAVQLEQLNQRESRPGYGADAANPPAQASGPTRARPADLSDTKAVLLC